ncbi:AAA family ATPase [Gluconobacter wancherniae]|uniref:AAA family ATPase n=1 Tax=Gluconobacter wancherniae TaxID=1307955 RepID=UPI001B8AFC14|nr:AAA family ATPase [Gluconobacter wancherniae]MBS1064293.1 AAA family ATPase [Gluconobacter wancherniae]
MAATWWTQSSELDPKQLEVVALPLEGNFLVLGPAGSGKTNLLLLRAAFLHKNGYHDIAVFTFGRVLKEFLATGAQHYPFSTDKIQTYMRWGAALLNANGIPFKGKGTFADKRAELFAGLSDLAAKDLDENKLDCILIDEAQDYSAAEIDLLFSFTDQIFAVGDSRQRINNVQGGLDRLGTRCGVTVTLEDHYRNGRKICRLADGIRNSVDSEDGLEAHSKYDESDFESTVRSFGPLPLNAQCDLAITEISDQLIAYPNELIGIVTPRQEELNEIWLQISTSIIADDCQLQQFSDGYEAFDPAKRIIVTTVHGAKGLEFRALHILGTNRVVKFPTQKNMSYTAVTRCKTSLRIYHDDSLPGYLEKGLACLNNTPASLSSIDDLFRA